METYDSNDLKNQILTYNTTIRTVLFAIAQFEALISSCVAP